MKNSWTKKKLFTVKFKGRKARALVWRKRIYKEWFEYAKLHQSHGGVIPKEFGKLVDIDDFEDWWKDPDYGFELFCEPYMDEALRLLDEPPKCIEPDNILVSINLNVDRDKLVQLFTKLLKQNQVSDEYSSLAKFQPSLDMKYLKHEKLKLFREVWILEKSGMAHKNIVKKLGMISKNVAPSSDPDLYQTLMLSALRKVSRYKRAVSLSFKQIEKGTFP